MFQYILKKQIILWQILVLSSNLCPSLQFGKKKQKKTFTSFSSVFQAVLFVIKLFNSDFSEFVTVLYTVYPFGRILVE